MREAQRALNEALAARQRDLLQKKKGSVEWAEALIAEATLQEQIALKLEAIHAEKIAAATIQAAWSFHVPLGIPLQSPNPFAPNPPS